MMSTLATQLDAQCCTGSANQSKQARKGNKTFRLGRKKQNFVFKDEMIVYV